MKNMSLWGLLVVVVVLCCGAIVVVMVVVMAFSSRASILGECSTIHSPPALFFFFKVEFSLRRLIPFFTPGLVHSGSAC